MATHYQIQLNAIRVIENGTIEHEKGSNGLAVTLYYPTPGKTSLVTTRRIELLDNVTYDYTQEDFSKQILFKEAILDSAYIVVELTSIKEPTKLGLIFYKLFKGTFYCATEARYSLFVCFFALFCLFVINSTLFLSLICSKACSAFAAPCTCITTIALLSSEIGELEILQSHSYNSKIRFQFVLL